MSVSVTVNGTTYTIPQSGETGWGAQVTAWIQSVSNNTLQKSGGSFTLTAEVDLGATYGIKSAYIKSQTANIASTGVLRLARADIISWRDNANSSDLELGVNASDQLTFNGNAIIPSSALTASRALQTSAGSVIETSSVTSTELALLSGKTSIVDLNSSQTLTNKTLTSPVVNTPTGIVKGDVGLGNVDNTSDATKNAAVATLTNKTLTTPVIASFISNGVTFSNPTADGTVGQVLQTNGSGSLSFTSALTDPMTTRGDIIVRNAANATARLPVGTAGQWLISDGTDINYSNTVTTAKAIDGSSDAVQLNVQGHSTQTSNILNVEKSDGTDLLSVTNTVGTLIRGTTTNDNAAAGFVGEIHKITRLRSNTLNPATNTAVNIGTTTSITLGAGDWDISGAVVFKSSTSTAIQQLDAAVSQTSATMPGSDTIGVPASNGEYWSTVGLGSLVMGNGFDYVLTIPRYRVSLSASTTFYLVGRAFFTVSILEQYGWLEARRVR